MSKEALQSQNLLKGIEARREMAVRFSDPFFTSFEPVFGISILSSGEARVVVGTNEEIPEELGQRLSEGIMTEVRFMVYDTGNLPQPQDN